MSWIFGKGPDGAAVPIAVDENGWILTKVVVQIEGPPVAPEPTPVEVTPPPTPSFTARVANFFSGG